MRQLPEYPWDLLAPFQATAAAHPDGVIDLSVGSPIDPVPERVRRALAEASNAPEYPTTTGTPELREAIAAWYSRRLDVRLAPQSVLPTVGSKELVALLPFFLGLSNGDAVVIPEIAYPSYEMGALLAGASCVRADNPDSWPANTKLVWLNSPANPTGRVLGGQQLRRAVARARQLGAIIASDECYAELNWQADKPVVSVLHESVCDGNHTGLLSVYSLSKQSNLAGYRAAFIAGDRELIAALTRVRKHAGMIVPLPVQQAMLAALDDDTATRAQQRRYGERRRVLLEALLAAGWQLSHSEAGLYLWVKKGANCWEALGELAADGILAAPGEFYGDAGTPYVRFALTASDAHIAQAAQRLTAGGTL